MDPITATLAANVVAVLAPYVAVGAQSSSEMRAKTLMRRRRLC